MRRKLMILEFQCLAVGKRDTSEYEQGERFFLTTCLRDTYIIHVTMYSHDSNQLTIYVV